MNHPTDPRALVEQMRDALEKIGDRFFPEFQMPGDRDEDWDMVRAAITAATEYLKQPQGEAIGVVESAVRGAGGFHVRLASGATMPNVGASVYAVYQIDEQILDAPASLGGARFGKGVAVRLLVEAAQRRHALEEQEQAQTPEMRQEAERKRRAMWDMFNGPLDAQAQVVDVSHMVNRFLGWNLPRDFNPDCHITFDRDAASYNQHSWPIGTNLLTADQAKAMFEYCLQGATHPQASEPAPSTAGEQRWVDRANELAEIFKEPVDAGAQPAQGELCTNCAADGKCMKRQALCYANGAAKQGERAEVIALLKQGAAISRERGINLDFAKIADRAAALLSAPALPVGELTDQSNLATIAGLEASTGHLSAMVDELRVLLARSLANFKTLHSAAKPDDGPDMDAIIPAIVFAAFVDEDAAIRYALNQTCHHDALAAASTQPERVPMTEAQEYKLLEHGQEIQKGDTVLGDDAVTWFPLAGWEVGMKWGGHLMPMRRVIERANGITKKGEQ